VSAIAGREAPAGPAGRELSRGGRERGRGHILNAFQFPAGTPPPHPRPQREQEQEKEKGQGQGQGQGSPIRPALVKWDGGVKDDTLAGVCGEDPAGGGAGAGAALEAERPLPPSCHAPASTHAAAAAPTSAPAPAAAAAAVSREASSPMSPAATAVAAAAAGGGSSAGSPARVLEANDLSWESNTSAESDSVASRDRGGDRDRDMEGEGDASSHAAVEAQAAAAVEMEMEMEMEMGMGREAVDRVKAEALKHLVSPNRVATSASASGGGGQGAGSPLPAPQTQTQSETQIQTQTETETETQIQTQIQTQTQGGRDPGLDPGPSPTALGSLEESDDGNRSHSRSRTEGASFTSPPWHSGAGRRLGSAAGATLGTTPDPQAAAEAATRAACEGGGGGDSLRTPAYASRRPGPPPHPSGSSGMRSGRSMHSLEYSAGGTSAASCSPSPACGASPPPSAAAPRSASAGGAAELGGLRPSSAGGAALSPAGPGPGPGRSPAAVLSKDDFEAILSERSGPGGRDGGGAGAAPDTAGFLSPLAYTGPTHTQATPPRGTGAGAGAEGDVAVAEIRVQDPAGTGEGAGAGVAGGGGSAWRYLLALALLLLFITCEVLVARTGDSLLLLPLQSVCAANPSYCQNAYWHIDVDYMYDPRPHVHRQQRRQRQQQSCDVHDPGSPCHPSFSGDTAAAAAAAGAGARGRGGGGECAPGDGPQGTKAKGRFSVAMTTLTGGNAKLAQVREDILAVRKRFVQVASLVQSGPRTIASAVWTCFRNALTQDSSSLID
jgi:hypothetical protein